MQCAVICVNSIFKLAYIIINIVCTFQWHGTRAINYQFVNR